jgi:hypothetical protein
MPGKRSKQQGLFESDQLYLSYAGADSFYGYLASQRNQLFRDEDFAEMYCPDNGRPGVLPSQLATALLLQTYAKVSDEEAKERADYDLRWKVALGIEVEERPFARSTLQLFRSQLILNEKMRTVFQRSLETAKEIGYFKPRKLRVVLDTSNILGRGAVKDKKHAGRAFRFETAVCATCPLRGDCIKTKANRGRTVSLHPQEALLQKAKAFQKSEAFKEYRQLCQVAEHRIARLMQLGIRQARYLGRNKTLFQLLMAATVANLTLVAGKTGQMRSGRGRGISFSSPFFAIFRKNCTPVSFLLHFIPQKPAFRLCF